MGKASRRKREAREGRQAVVAQLRSEGVAQGMRVAAEGGPKVSAAFGKLIDPYLDGDIGSEEYRALATIGALAWNLANLPETVSDDRLRSLLADAGVSESVSFRGLLEEMKERKQRLFPNDQRLIVRTEVHEQPDGTFYLTVAAVSTDKGAADV